MCCGVPLMRALRLATRRSPLAMAQSRAMGELIAERAGMTLELVEVVTQGDVDRASLASIGGTGSSWRACARRSPTDAPTSPCTP